MHHGSGAAKVKVAIPAVPVKIHDPQYCYQARLAVNSLYVFTDRRPDLMTGLPLDI